MHSLRLLQQQQQQQQQQAEMCCLSIYCGRTARWTDRWACVAVWLACLRACVRACLLVWLSGLLACSTSTITFTAVRTVLLHPSVPFPHLPTATIV
jgi:hypothetical protein